MGDRCPARRCSASNLFRTWWNDQHSSGSEPVYAGFACRLLSHSKRFGFVSGSGDDAEAYTQSEDSGDEYEHGDSTSDNFNSETDTCTGQTGNYACNHKAPGK